MAYGSESGQYSEAFKRQVVQEYEAGQSINQLRRKHGIGGKMTIQKWVRCYSRRGVGVCPAPGVASPEDGAALTGEAERLRERVRLLEKAVADLTVDNLLLQSTLAFYQEAYGPDVAKKTGRSSSSGLGSKARGR